MWLETCCCCKQSGGLGLLGAGSMHPERCEHIRKCHEYASCTFRYEYSLMYPQIEEIMQIVATRVKIVFICRQLEMDSWLHERSIGGAYCFISRFVKAKAGVDAVVAEGFRAVGTMGGRLPPMLIPAYACSYYTSADCHGGIATGGMLAARCWVKVCRLITLPYCESCANGVRITTHLEGYPSAFESDVSASGAITFCQRRGC